MSSRRAKRMEKHHKRKAIGSLNLISLMDIFTILVFFLLVNSQDVETLPNAKDLQLPESYAEEKSRENVVIMITADQILVQLEKSHSGDLKAEAKAIAADANMQLSFFQLDDPVLMQIKDEIESIDINTLTPVEALMKLNEIKKYVGG